MLSVQEISDRLELQQLLTDYSAVGGAVGTPAEIVPWLRENLALFSAYIHLNANIDLRVDGDERPPSSSSASDTTTRVEKKCFTTSS